MNLLNSVLSSRAGLAASILAVSGGLLFASDHADPLTPYTSYPRELLDDGTLTSKENLELSAGITDLFIFPAKADETVAFFPPRDEYWTTDIEGDDRMAIDQMVPEQRALLLQLNKEEYATYKTIKDDSVKVDSLFQQARQRRFNLQNLEQSEIDRIKYLIVIFCVRRELITAPPKDLDLKSYNYAIHFDTKKPITYDEDLANDQPNRARYGGTIKNPEQISANLNITVHLNDDGTAKDVSYQGFKDASGIVMYPDKDKKESGLRDDPFIFPRFFRKNVMAMAFKIPITAFETGLPDHILLWGTTSRGSQQIDHVGRSLRTQQPRFNFLNDKAPKDHVADLKKEAANQFFLYDYLRRLGFDSFFEYRYWDYVPDVMVYNPKLRTRYPNGRLLTDDVAAILAQHGDTLLVELSYKSPTSQAWPRKTVNDKPFMEKFPYLAPPWKAPAANSATPAADEVTPISVAKPVNPANKMIIYVGIVLFLVFILAIFLLGWFVARLEYFNRKPIEYQ